MVVGPFQVFLVGYLLTWEGVGALEEEEVAPLGETACHHPLEALVEVPLVEVRVCAWDLPYLDAHLPLGAGASLEAEGALWEEAASSALETDHPLVDPLVRLPWVAVVAVVVVAPFLEGPVVVVVAWLPL